MTDEMAQTMMSRTLVQSFKRWASKDVKFKSLYKRLPDAAFDIVTAGFTELSIHKPGTWELWWAQEHQRFKGTVKNEEMRLVHELMYNFLTKYARGTLKDDTESTSKRRSKK